LLKQRFPDAVLVNLLAAEEHRRYLARPELIEEVVAARPQSKRLIIDEIQKAPALLEAVHKLMDEQSGWQFILTGSSSRKLKRGGVDLLAGRAVPLTLHPFLAAELGERFNLEQSLRLGMLPLVLDAADPEQTLRGYVSIYLKEEVQQEGLVRRVGDFARFLETMALSHGSLLNTAAIARECEVNRKTVEGYLGVLEDLLLGFRLPVFARRAKRILIKHAKFYYFDCGVFRSTRPAGPLDRPEEAEGAALEGVVAQHLRAWTSYRGDRERLYFWRTKAGLEVDFVVYGPGTFVGIEVKNGRRVDRRDTRSLREFAADYPEASTCLVYRGKERRQVEGIPCIPAGEFLSSIHPQRPLL
jgi:predicted AAA+ superfamily ATPase